MKPVTGLLIILFWGISTCVFAQVDIIETSFSYKKDTAIWMMKFAVEEGFYVAANDHSGGDDGSIPISIVWTNIPVSLKAIQNVQWPVSNIYGNKSVFTEGEYIIQQLFIFSGRTKKSPVLLAGKILFQACREEQCFPPQELKFGTKM